MSKSDKEHVPTAKPAAFVPPPAPEPLTGCVICGSYAGELVTVAGQARAHDACGASRPDLIAKVKARA